MGQRSKVLDIEGPTPKFLYAIIKQLNLKDVSRSSSLPLILPEEITHICQIDWNKVASDLEISNGHAARMRYSRFKSQIDPNTPRAKKKNAKKGGKGDPKGDLQTPQTISHPPFSEPGVVPKLEPTQSPFQLSLNPFVVKYEPGTPDSHGMQGPSHPQEAFYSPFTQLMSPAQTMSSPRMRPPRYMEHLDPVSYGPQPDHASVGGPYSLAAGTYAPVLASNPSPFAKYPPFSMPNDFHMQDFHSQTPGFHNGPVIPWEPVPQQQSESAPSPARIKEETGFCEKNTESVVIKVEEVLADKICIE